MICGHCLCQQSKQVGASARSTPIDAVGTGSLSCFPVSLCLAPDLAPNKKICQARVQAGRWCIESVCLALVHESSRGTRRPNPTHPHSMTGEDAGRPRSNIRFSRWHPIKLSRFWDSRSRARSCPPKIRLRRKTYSRSATVAGSPTPAPNFAGLTRRSGAQTRLVGIRVGLWCPNQQLHLWAE